MKRLTLLAVVAPLLLAARPGNEYQLVTQLNGQPSRFVQADGGRSIVYVSSGSTACMPLTGATNSVGAAVSPNVLVFVPPMPVLLCIRPSVFSPAWDGGCNHFPGDENMGVPLPAGVPQYITPDSVARAICVVQDAGAIAMPVWTAQ